MMVDHLAIPGAYVLSRVKKQVCWSLLTSC